MEGFQMKFRTLLAGAAAIALLATPVLAAEYLGGAVMSTDLGGKMVLTDANGMTLYIFDRDEPGVSNCYEQCAINWPPLMADASATGEGDFTGDGVGGVWHLAIE
jgi:predicted lipoprotein with Yx(FWY)xxD motif